MSKFSVGDELRVREWGDMKREFGINSYGINCELFFTYEMEPICGKPFTVKAITQHAGCSIYHSEEGIENGFLITEDMLEPIQDIPPFEIASENELATFLFT